MATWYWESRDERRDIDFLTHEIFKLDLGALPELTQSPLVNSGDRWKAGSESGAGAAQASKPANLTGEAGRASKKARSGAVGKRPGQTQWRVECALLLRQQSNSKKLQQAKDQSANKSTNRMFRIGNPVAWPNEIVMVIPNEKPSPGGTAQAGQRRTPQVRPSQAAQKPKQPDQPLARQQRQQQSQEPRNAQQHAQQAGGRYTVFQASNFLSSLPFNLEYNTRREVIIEGQEFHIGDFFINVGVCRVPPSTYLVVQVRHAPCFLRTDAQAFTEIATALGIGTRFAKSKALDANLTIYDDILPREYGPMHQALEMVALFIAVSDA